MKSLHLGLVLTFIVFVVICTKPVHADSNLIKILDVSVQPSTIKINNTFLISATIMNNSTYPVYLTSGSCVPAFSIEFDSHSKQVYPDIACTLEEIIQRVDPNVETTISSANKPGTIYKAIQAGTANANITIPYFIKNQTATDYSNIYYSTSKSFQFQISDATESKIGNQLPIGTTFKSTLDSPLRQFKSGIKAEDVKCGSNLHLIIKAEDGSFACVTIKTGIKLVLREWAVTFGTGISTSDYTKCDIPYQQSDTGVAVLYMPTNIIGKICVQYHNLNNTPTTIGMRIFEANDLTHNATSVTAWTYDSTLEANANKTVVYFMKTGNKTGFYGASLNCGGFPLAVGYDNNSAITANNFPWIGQVFHCGVITYDSHIESTTGIGVKYIPYP